MKYCTKREKYKVGNDWGKRTTILVAPLAEVLPSTQTSPSPYCCALQSHKPPIHIWRAKCSHSLQQWKALCVCGAAWLLGTAGTGQLGCSQPGPGSLTCYSGCWRKCKPIPWSGAKCCLITDLRSQPVFYSPQSYFWIKCGHWSSLFKLNILLCPFFFFFKERDI